MFSEHLNENDRERGQVGIGTLIVFIALVLVAAIAAGVLINTAGFLQNQAESTGQESTQQVTQTLDVQGTVGTVNSSGAVDEIKLTVAKSPGAGPVNVTASTIQIVTPRGADTLEGVDTAIKGGDHFEAGSTDVLDDESSPVTLTLKLADTPGDTEDFTTVNAEASNAMENLSPGEEATLTITTPSGGSTTTVIEVPDPVTANDNEEIRL
jgi:flagellin FlaB